MIGEGPHRILFYDYVAEVADRRRPHRAAQLQRIAAVVTARRIERWNLV
jgi:hypothetical protein